MNFITSSARAVEDGGGIALGAHAQDADQDVAGLGDAGVGEHPLQVLLGDGREIPDGHGQDRKRHEDVGEVGAALLACGGQADQHGHRADFRGGGDEGRRLMGGALVDVGGPDVEREDGELEEKPAQGEQEADLDQGPVRSPRQDAGEFGHGGGTGRPIEQGQPEQHHGRCRDPHEEKFQRRLHRHLPRPAQGHQHVERITRQLQGDVDAQQVYRARQQHHGERADEEQQVELGVVAGLDAVQPAAQADHQEKPQAEQDLEDLGEEVDAVGLRKQRALGLQPRQAGHHHQGGQAQRGNEVPPRAGRLDQAERQENEGCAKGAKLRSEQCPAVHGSPRMNGTAAESITSNSTDGKSPKNTITAARIMRGIPRPKGMSARRANFACIGP